MTWKQRLLWVPQGKQRHWSVGEKVAIAVLCAAATAICFVTLPYGFWREITIPVTPWLVLTVMVVVHDQRTRRQHIDPAQERRRPRPW